MLTGPAWILVAGCGVCLMLAVGMAVIAATMGSKYRESEHKVKQIKRELTETKVRLAETTVRLKASMVRADPETNLYLIREEEYA